MADLKDVDKEKEILEAVEYIQIGEKEKLESLYGVYIHMNAVVFACNIVWRYYSNGVGGGCLNVVLLQERARELLYRACKKMRDDIDANAEEEFLDNAEFSLYRSLIELNEIKREREPDARIWVPRVEEEYNGFKEFWEGFVGKWEPLFTSQRRLVERNQEIHVLEQMRTSLTSHLQDDNSGKISSLVPDLNSALCYLFKMTHENIKQNVTVNPCIIAEVASTMTGVPASWLLNSFKPPLQGLERRLLKRLLGQDRIVKAVTSSLLRAADHGGRNRPVGSFLFLCGACYGRGELIQALTKELYDSKDLLTRFDMSHYRDYNHEEHGVWGKIMEAVKHRPYGVLMLENVDKAHDYAVAVLIDILRHGRLIELHGGEVDFSNTLIVLTSDVGIDRFSAWCYNSPDDECQFMNKNRIESHSQSKTDHICAYLPVYREAKTRFKSELLEELDDVVVFNGLAYRDYTVITRLYLRSLTDALKQKGLIVYPSEAALKVMIRKGQRKKVSAESISVWLQAKVMPMLSHIVAENVIQDVTNIYIDVLVGRKKLSYRLERDRSQGSLIVFEGFKKSLEKLRLLYRKEKERASGIYCLRRKYLELLPMDEGFVLPHDVLQSFVCMVDEMISNAVDVNSMCPEYGSAPINSLNAEPLLRQKELADERSRYGLEGLLNVLSGRISEAVDVIVEALMRSIQAPHNPPHHPAKSFLCLGLTSAGKEDLAKCLAKICAADPVTKLIQINMEEHNEFDSFLGYVSLEQNGLEQQECAKTRRHQIILVDQIEKANMSVFSTIISVLDHGVLCDAHGLVADFCDTIFVIMSDLGNKEILASLAGHYCMGSVERDMTEQGGGARFRAELLNRVDEILIFNPYAQEQLGIFSRLSMRVGPHIMGPPRGFLVMAFNTLFGKIKRPYSKKWRKDIKYAVSHLSESLIGNGKYVVLANRSCSTPAIYGSCQYIQLSSVVQNMSSLFESRSSSVS